jgi:hypothetical protein
MLRRFTEYDALPSDPKPHGGALTFPLGTRLSGIFCRAPLQILTGCCGLLLFLFGVYGILLSGRWAHASAVAIYASCDGDKDSDFIGGECEASLYSCARIVAAALLSLQVAVSGSLLVTAELYICITRPGSVLSTTMLQFHFLTYYAGKAALLITCGASCVAVGCELSRSRPSSKPAKHDGETHADELKFELLPLALSCTTLIVGGLNLLASLLCTCCACCRVCYRCCCCCPSGGTAVCDGGDVRDRDDLLCADDDDLHAARECKPPAEGHGRRSQRLPRFCGEPHEFHLAGGGSQEDDDDSFQLGMDVVRGASVGGSMTSAGRGQTEERGSTGCRGRRGAANTASKKPRAKEVEMADLQSSLDQLSTELGEKWAAHRDQELSYESPEYTPHPSELPSPLSETLPSPRNSRVLVQQPILLGDEHVTAY